MTDKSTAIKEFYAKSAKYVGNETEDVPVLKAGDVTVHFDEFLLEDICRYSSEFKKDFNSILTYGYIGHSNGGKNGIVDVRDKDINLLSKIDSYVRSIRGQATLIGYGFNLKNLSSVKVVAHKPNGERVIGVKDSDKVLLFDKVSYKK